ncbi:MAG: hypothetical protein PHR83_07800 [Paludibacter sp.]|nr:hypothetical protein [Paludibacter sp.]
MLNLDAYKGVKIIETIENYSIVKNELVIDKHNANFCSESYIIEDKEFWYKVTNNQNEFWNKKFSFYHFVVSDWVARVPGLFWTEYSAEIRKHSEQDIAIKSKDWIVFHPPGKSKKVLGGIGTIHLPPNDEGKRLISITSSCNASVGIPILIFPEVYDLLNLKQGDVVDIEEAKWQQMDIPWAKRFASTERVPRGYLIIDSIDQIRISRNENVPVLYHPFSIMEYQSKDALLYDFVYLSLDSKVKNQRREIETFFNDYAKQENRNGSYLINPDITNPTFETQYISPADMQRPSEKAKLDLIFQRIRNTSFNHTTLDELIHVLPYYYNSSVSISALSQRIGISPAFLADDNAASMSAQLINLCIKKNKTEELIDRMIVEHPIIFRN